MSESGSITEKWLRIEQLRQGKYQPRKLFNKSYLINLAESIKQDGVLEPLIVRSAGNNNLYEIIAGECRWRAAQIAGLSSVPCRIGIYSDEQACRIALVENTTRASLNAIEKAEGITRLVEEFSYTHSQVSQVLCIPRTEVTNTLRLLKLHTSVQDMLRAGDLSEAHGKILAGIKNTNKQYFLASECINKQWSTRALDKAIKNSEKSPNRIQNNSSKKDSNTVKLERDLSEYFGSATQISLEKDNSGFLNIRFYNMDTLQGILQKAGFLKADGEFVAEKY
jgi:ParB family chromosome partitioning protein